MALGAVTLPLIGYVESPFADKFAVPRQPGLAPAVVSLLRFYKPYCTPQAFREIEGYSHLHVLFLFDRVEYRDFHPEVRPPRLGGNQRVGVFATRSPYRPSRLGLSVVKLERILHLSASEVALEVTGADMVNGTPVVDIKPYVPFVDAHPEATGGFAPEPPPLKTVSFSPEALMALSTLSGQEREAIAQVLSQDPRPAYKEAQGEDERVYHAVLYGYDIAFCVTEGGVYVLNALQSNLGL